jgi:hypothetical protein
MVLHVVLNVFTYYFLKQKLNPAVIFIFTILILCLYYLVINVFLSVAFCKYLKSLNWEGDIFTIGKGQQHESLVYIYEKCNNCFITVTQTVAPVSKPIL